MCAGHGLCAFSSLINLSAWALKDSAPVSNPASLGSYLGSLLQSASRNVLLGFVQFVGVPGFTAACAGVMHSRGLWPARACRQLACMHACHCDHATCRCGRQLMLWFFACSHAAAACSAMVPLVSVCRGRAQMHACPWLVAPNCTVSWVGA